MQEAWVANLTWREVEDRINAGAMGILPVAAACKEHGLHLPMNTDQIQAEWLARQLAQHENILIWPTVTYGYYPAFTDYPGSCTLQNETFIQLVGEILKSVINSRVRHILIINTGVSTIAPLGQAIIAPGCKNYVTLFNVYSGKRFLQVQNNIEQQKNGNHADEIETSIMLAIAPEYVDMKLAETCYVEITQGILNRQDQDMPGYSASGVIGNPNLATVDKGRQLCEAMLQDLDDAYRNL
jgi:creatinine amidohydrolase